MAKVNSIYGNVSKPLGDDFHHDIITIYMIIDHPPLMITKVNSIYGDMSREGLLATGALLLGAGGDNLNIKMDNQNFMSVCMYLTLSLTPKSLSCNLSTLFRISEMS